MAEAWDMPENHEGKDALKRPETGRHSGVYAPPWEAGRGVLPLIIFTGLLAMVLAATLLAAPFFLQRREAAAAAPPAAYVDIGGPFRMTDQEGRAVDQHVLDGKWSAVFFGYVSCPDVCPATMQTLANAQEKLGADAERFQVVFVSVDPERDTPKLLKTFLAEPGFPPRALGLTGRKDQMAAMAHRYRAYYAYMPRTAAQGGGYDVGHSSAIYLMNPKGQMVASLTEGQGPAAIADQIRAAMRGGA